MVKTAQVEAQQSIQHLVASGSDGLQQNAFQMLKHLNYS